MPQSDLTLGDPERSTSTHPDLEAVSIHVSRKGAELGHM